MKRVVCIFLVLICVLFVSCGKTDMGQHDTKVIISTDTEEIEAHIVFKECKWYSPENNLPAEWVYQEGKSNVVGALTSLVETGGITEVPTINYSSSISADIPENNGLGKYKIYSPDNFEAPIEEFDDISQFSKLENGEWHVVFDVSYRGKYIEEDKQYEMSGFFYVFKLQVGEEVTE